MDNARKIFTISTFFLIFNLLVVGPVIAGDTVMVGLNVPLSGAYSFYFYV